MQYIVESQRLIIECQHNYVSIVYATAFVRANGMHCPSGAANRQPDKQAARQTLSPLLTVLFALTLLAELKLNEQKKQYSKRLIFAKRNLFSTKFPENR